VTVDRELDPQVEIHSRSDRTAPRRKTRYDRRVRVPDDDELASLETAIAEPDRKRMLAGKEAIDELWRALETARGTITRLSEAVRMLRRERDALQEKAAPGPKPVPAARAAASIDDVPAALIAPFHPSNAQLESAKTDPLAALAIQVAKAMAVDASELDRARLIAMSFAASRGDLENFWLARAQRSANKVKRD
jgi:hypothetical protein